MSMSCPMCSTRIEEVIRLRQEVRDLQAKNDELKERIRRLEPDLPPPPGGALALARTLLRRSA